MSFPSRRSGLRTGAALGVACALGSLGLRTARAQPGAAGGLGSVLSPAAKPVAGPASASAFQSWLQDLIRGEEVPGAVALVATPAGRVVAHAGMADVARQRPVRADTRFYIASSGKLATSVAVLQLEQRGAFRIHDRVLPLLAPLPGIEWARLPNLQQLTVEQLLRHRSGLPEYFDEAFEESLLRPGARMPSVAEMLAPLMGERPQAAPGSEYDYCNTNYVLLGHLVASVHRSTYAQALSQLQWRPLEMTRTSVGAPAGAAADDVARTYVRSRGARPSAGSSIRREGTRAPWRDVSPISFMANTGDGAVVTTVDDYARFFAAVFRDESLLGPQSAARLCRAEAGRNGDASYGMGCMLERLSAANAAWGHNGSVSGCTAETWYVPQRRAVLMLLTNGELQRESADLIQQMLTFAPA